MKDPKELEINGKMYYLTKFPASVGREIMVKYPLSAIPSIADYSTNEEVMYKLMGFVYVEINGNKIPLSSKALYDNHVADWETSLKLEWAMIEYNCSFFRDGRASTFLNDALSNLPEFIIKMWTLFSERLSPPEKLPSTN